MRLFWRKYQGFSMIEVIAAIAMLEIILVSVLSMYTLTGTGRPLQEQTFIANVVLQRAIEEIRSKPFTHDPSGTGITYFNHPDYPVDISQNTNYLGNSYLKEVVIVVNWNATPGNPKSIGFNLLVADI